jgi:LmbE family N-acetylglucosaminyl deacetylase
MGVCSLSGRNSRFALARILLWMALVLLLALSVHFEKISIQILFLALAAGALAALCFSRLLSGKAVRKLLICAAALLGCVALLLSAGWSIAAGSAAYVVPEVNRDNLFADRRVMLIVPHEDDEINVLSGVMEQYTIAGSELAVVFVTNGDSETSGETRIREALRATALYGIPEQNVLFLGYGDTGREQTTHLYHAASNELYRSSAGRTHTYGTKTHPAFHSSDYTRENLISDLQAALEIWLPDTIYCVDYDAHPDHRATSLAFEEAMGRILRQRADYIPLVYKGFAYSTAWQAADDFYADNLLSSIETSDTPYMSENNVYLWSERLRLPVSADTLSRLEYQTLTQRALLAHDSQNAVWQTGRILNSDKVFWQRYTTSLLYRAKFEASSGDASVLNDFKWIDSSNVLSGDPPFDNVWSSEPGDSAPSVTITLAQPTVLKELRLYDQPLMADNILGATILLDGVPAATVGALVKNGSATVIPLQESAPISQIEIRITGSEGEQWGLTEVEAYAEPPQPGIALAKLTDEAGNFLYDAWTNSDGTLRLKTYRSPAATADWLDGVTVSSDNPRCPVIREGDAFVVSCPVGESCIVRLSDAQNEAYSDAIFVSNPTPQARAWMHTLQWMEAHHLDFIHQRAYYRTIFNALASRLF